MLEDIGRNRRRVRRDRDFTQAQLARSIGVRQQELSAIERGLRPPRALVDRVARVLGVHSNELLRSATDVPIVERRLADRTEAV